MKQKILGTLLLAGALVLAWLLPFRSRDVAKLIPVEALIVELREGQIVLSGGNCQGQGKTWNEASADLLKSGNGDVFLSTADQLILTEEALSLLPNMADSRLLRPAAMVYVAVGDLPKPEEAAEFLSAHSGGVTLQQIKTAKARGERIVLPVLMNTEGGLRLHEGRDR